MFTSPDESRREREGGDEVLQYVNPREVGPIAKLRRTATIQKFSTLILQMFTSPDESRR